MPDVFISHSSKDAELANRLCDILEENGLECWIAPRNIMPGDDWASAITKAIKSSKAFIVIYSENSVESTQVPKEIMLAGGNGNYIIPYRVDDTPLKENYEYHLGTSHWIQADIEKGIFKGEELIEAVNRGIGHTTVNVHVSVKNTSPIYINKKNKFKSFMWVVIGVLILVAILFTMLMFALIPGADNTGKDKKDNTDDEKTAVNSSQSTGTYLDTTPQDSDKNPQADDNVIESKTEVMSSPAKYKPFDNVGSDVYKDGKNDFYSESSDGFYVMGNQYKDGYVLNGMNGHLMYNTNGITKMNFSAGYLEQQSGYTENTLYIVIDGVEYNYYVVPKEGILKNITIELDGKEHIVHIYTMGSEDATEICVFDMTVVKEYDVIRKKIPEYADASPDTVKPYAYSENLFISNGGNMKFAVNGLEINGGYCFDTADSGMMFNVYGYNSVTFDMGIVDGSNFETGRIYFYLDGYEIDYYEVEPGMPAKEYTIDLNGGGVLYIFHEGSMMSPNIAIYNMYFEGQKNLLTMLECDQDEFENPEVEYQGNITYSPEIVGNLLIVGENVITEGYIALNSGDASLKFNVEGFNRCQFDISAMNINENDISIRQRSVTVYVDGVEDNTFLVGTGGSPFEFVIDTQGAKTIELRFDTGNEKKASVAVYNICMYNVTEQDEENFG